ncbi:putative sigma-54 modulation protein [Orenia metallireducens]|jgi:putative sigma-54 modulation protein|uniref:Ribosome hibernation promoting factor n=1 Tax=Orenia metallireducens TaxID=1413210 RepID=A0A285FY20_9FIRM|nr:ribosome-associated translation inhibitor RaiA [Orenia metallireducens]PRX35558.1 putative sigma-54 modulation protein [Orenia metallireducens]SNY16048.1 putative sigma-54 modulation protein [Orenia metallireducens]
MKFIVRGKNIEITDSLRDYAEDKIGKVRKYFEYEDVIEAQVSLEVERGRHIVEVTLFVDGLILRAEDKTDDMYTSIDGVVSKLEGQIRKYKTKINRKIKGINKEDILDIEDDNDNDEDEHEVRVVKTKKFAIKPMYIEEAVMQMDLLHHDFFVFSNAKTEEVNVVYKRNDGNYGLIEPTF